MTWTDEEPRRTVSSRGPESFNQLVLRQLSIHALAYRTLGRDEDARHLSETFLRAYRGLHAFKGQAKFSSDADCNESLPRCHEARTTGAARGGAGRYRSDRNWLRNSPHPRRPLKIWRFQAEL